MCPDHQLLSVYFDGEMPSPWKEKLEDHIAACPQCAKKIDGYRRLTIKPGAEDEAALNAAKDRVWQHFDPAAGSNSIRLVTPRYSRGMWQRHISIPIPAAAAAAILVIAALAFALINRPSGTGAAPVFMATESEFEIPGIIPAANMESVLQYLSGRDSSEMLIILPENRSFTNYGEPTIVKAADYTRQQTTNVRRKQ